MNQYNKKAIQDTYKNAHIALQSLSNLMPSVNDEKLKKELSTEYSNYKKQINEISDFIKKNKLVPQDINVFKKAIMWTSIKMKTLSNNSKNQIAEMLIKGSVMGINELTAMKNESKNLNEDVKNHILNLLELEEQNVEKLKAFL